MFIVYWLYCVGRGVLSKTTNEDRRHINSITRSSSGLQLPMNVDVKEGFKLSQSMVLVGQPPRTSHMYPTTCSSQVSPYELLIRGSRCEFRSRIPPPPFPESWNHRNAIIGSCAFCTPRARWWFSKRWVWPCLCKGGNLISSASWRLIIRFLVERNLI